MSELQPVFTIQVWLDGDDDAAASTGDVLETLVGTLEMLQKDRMVRRYTIKVKP